MKSININQLQDRASEIIRQAEAGEVVEVVRYSTPVAYLVGKSEYERLKSGEDCKKCVRELRAIAGAIKKK